MILGEV